MARTTLALDDDLLKQLKQRAAGERRTVGALANDLLRRALAPVPRRSRYRLHLTGWTAEAQPGADILDRTALFEVMERGSRP
ncbi:MAG: ribbon-helix-helix protein, CopG family [Proteobacteria bacterium]|nr:ribbon-helix-helix protein, CopG family [Pseudomonadota bacterium]